MGVSQMVRITRPFDVRDRSDDIPQDDASAQPFQPAAGVLRRIPFRLDAGNHLTTGGDLDLLARLHALEIGRQVLDEVAHGDALRTKNLYSLGPTADWAGWRVRLRSWAALGQVGELQVRHYARRTVNTYEQ